jgi:hypothetical protein
VPDLLAALPPGEPGNARRVLPDQRFAQRLLFSTSNFVGFFGLLHIQKAAADLQYDREPLRQQAWIGTASGFFVTQ